VTENITVGIAAGYAHTGTNSTGGGWLDTNSGRGGIYSTFFGRGFYLHGFVGGGFNGYDTKRVTLGGTASGSTNRGEFNALVSGGYEVLYGPLTFGPVASLGYTYVDFAGFSFSEHGSIVPLQIVSKGESSLRTNPGVSLSYALKAGTVILTPILQATWQHEYLYGALPVKAQFASGAGGVFTVYGPALGHDSALVNAGLNVQLNPAVEVYFGYNGQVGRGDYDSHGGSCSVHIDF
jgi:outer membrane autotransporter protein